MKTDKLFRALDTVEDIMLEELAEIQRQYVINTPIRLYIDCGDHDIDWEIKPASASRDPKRWEFVGEAILAPGVESCRECLHELISDCLNDRYQKGECHE